MGIAMLASEHATFASPAEALRAAVDRVGSQAAMARLLGLAQPSVWRWIRHGQPLPPKHVLKVEAETGISRHALRPDLYPDESGHDATRADDRRRPTAETFGAMEPTR